MKALLSWLVFILFVTVTRAETIHQLKSGQNLTLPLTLDTNFQGVLKAVFVDIISDHDVTVTLIADKSRFFDSLNEDSYVFVVPYDSEIRAEFICHQEHDCLFMFNYQLKEVYVETIIGLIEAPWFIFG